MDGIDLSLIGTTLEWRVRNRGLGTRNRASVSTTSASYSRLEIWLDAARRAETYYDLLVNSNN